MKRGLFIVFEGVEGSGKSTQIKLLSSYLTSRSYPVVTTREPGGDKVCEEIRNILLNPEINNLDYKAEALLYAASRAQHVTKVIKPALDSGKIVLCDRFVDSSLAYQGFGRGLSLDFLEEINGWATQGISPDIVFVFLLPPEEGLKRATKRAADRIESEDIEFHKRVAEGYRRLVEKNPRKYQCFDALRDSNSIHKEVIRLVESFLGERD